MERLLILGPDQLAPTAVVAAAVFLLLAVPLGLCRRTAGLAVLVALAVTWLYPEGSRGLITDTLRPMRQLRSDTAVRKDARTEAIDRAVDAPGARGSH